MRLLNELERNLKLGHSFKQQKLLSVFLIWDKVRDQSTLEVIEWAVYLLRHPVFIGCVVGVQLSSLALWYLFF